MTKAESELAHAAGQLETTRSVNVRDLEATQLVTSSDLKEMEYLQLVGTGEAEPVRPQRRVIALRAVSNLAPAAALLPVLRMGLTRAALFSALLAASCAFLPAANSDTYTEAFPTVPEANWAGLRLIILPQSKALQHYGYQELYQDANKDTDKEYLPLRYEEYVGRIVRVVGIGRGNLPGGDHVDEADLQLEGNNKIIHGDIDHGCMTDVAPASDLETARKLYLGKTLWLSSDHLSTYDPQKDTSDAPGSPALHEAFQRVPIKQYSPVKVLDVVPGWYASAPTRFIVQEEAGTEAVQGYVDVHMSDTNIPDNLRAVARFQDTFSESDPRTKYPWSPKVWSALENKQIFLGMTAPQVRMSWGAPKEVQTAGQSGAEQWVYDPAHILILKEGVLEDISSQPAPAK